MSETECCICFENVLLEPLGTCTHLLHRECIEKLLLQGGEAKCPLCRQNLIEENTFVIHNFFRIGYHYQCDWVIPTVALPYNDIRINFDLLRDLEN